MRSMGHAGQVCVRRRSPPDLGHCVGALAAVHAADRDPQRWPSDPVQWLSPQGCLTAWVAVADGAVAGHVVVVGGVDDRVVGEVTRRPIAQLAAVSRLFVAPTARGRGLARLLRLAAMRAAKGCS